MTFGYVILLGRFPYLSYVIAMFIITLGEMLILPAVPAAAAQISPLGKEGAYQGVVGGATSGGRMIGPLLGGIMYDFGGGLNVWILAISFMGMSIMLFFLYDKALNNFLSAPKVSNAL